MSARVPMRASSLVRRAVIASLLGLAAVGGAVQAATATATATITGLSGSLLSFSNDLYLSDASTPYQSGFDVGPVLPTYSFSTAQPNGDLSAAVIDAPDGFGPRTSAAASNSGQGMATVLWSFDWAATGTGTARVDLGYLYDATVIDHQPGESALASSFISLLLEGTSLKTDAFHFFDSVNGSTGAFDDLFLEFGVTEGQTGTLSVLAASNASVAPVPVPAALPLLLSGLAAMGAVARRRRKPSA